MNDNSKNYLADLRGTAPFAGLAATICRLIGGRKVDFFPSPGNWGDALINLGSRQFLAYNAINVRELRRADVGDAGGLETADRVAIVGGGGGWNRNWFSTIGFVEKIQDKYQHVVVLPSSYDGNMVGAIDRGRVTLYTRAADSKIVGFPFCHDMAFYTHIMPLPEQRLGHPLIAFRRDKERHPSAVDPDRNWDLSLLGTADTDPIDFFRIVNRFKTIITDRLHVAIAGAMLRRKVTLLDGNYGKNEGVFRASLQSNFPSVELTTWRSLGERSVSGMNRVGESGYPGMSST